MPKKIKKEKVEEKNEEKEEEKQEIKTHSIIKERLSDFWNQFKTNHKLQIILIVYLAVLAAICITIMLYWPENEAFIDKNTRYKINLNEFKSNKNTNLPLTMPRRLDGIVVATADSNKLPICVMIENAAFDGVRPQAGLSSASLVYEIIVEGGITRLMAVFGGDAGDPVGPVRSARDTYLEFASELDCMYTHAGGSYTAMLALEELGLKDLDGLREAKYFWRDPNRVSPHNFFTKTENLEGAAINGHNWKETPVYDGWKFKDETKNNTAGVSEVNIFFGGAYDVQYRYNSENNNYERYNGGIEHKDRNTDQILTAKNIIIEKVPPGEFIEGKGRINFDVTGKGDAVIFQEGKAIEGTWSKPDRLARTKYYDDAGKEIEFIRGNTWIEIVPEDKVFDWK